MQKESFYFKQKEAPLNLSSYHLRLVLNPLATWKIRINLNGDRMPKHPFSERARVGEFYSTYQAEESFHLKTLNFLIHRCDRAFGKGMAFLLGIPLTPINSCVCWVFRSIQSTFQFCLPYLSLLSYNPFSLKTRLWSLWLSLIRSRQRYERS